MASFLDTIDFRYGGTIVEGVAKKVAKRRAGKVRNPLEPLASFNWMMLSLIVLGFGASVVATLFGSGSILGWGHGVFVCVNSGESGGDTSETSWLRPHAGVNVGSEDFRLCTDKPSTGQRWWYTLENLPGTVTVIAAVLITFLALRLAERQGLYTPGFATRLRVLGWFLIVDSVLTPTAKVLAAHRLWSSMADGPMSLTWNVTWPYLGAGLALLSLARIMRVGSDMREDLEGVV